MIEKFLNKATGSLQPALYVVATPIGNLADITLRALAVLERADLVCAEDTRVTAQLLAAYGIQAKLMSVREHNEQQMADKVVAALSDGLIVAQVSDAGTPAVCDPGARLAARVRGFQCRARGGRECGDGGFERGGCVRVGFLFQRFPAAEIGRTAQAVRAVVGSGLSGGDV